MSKKAIADILLSRMEMLEEYFAVKLDENGLVQQIPMLLREYQPNLDKLPLFLMRLGPQVYLHKESIFQVNRVSRSTGSQRKGASSLFFENLPTSTCPRSLPYL